MITQGIVYNGYSPDGYPISRNLLKFRDLPKQPITVSHPDDQASAKALLKEGSPPHGKQKSDQKIN